MFEVADAVRFFPKNQRYDLGSKLSALSVDAYLQAQDFFYAASDRELQGIALVKLSEGLKQIKARLRIAVKLQCFSVRRYCHLSEIANSVGKQCGGLIKSTKGHLNGQSPAAKARRERPETLSTRAACVEAIR